MTLNLTLLLLLIFILLSIAVAAKVYTKKVSIGAALIDFITPNSANSLIVIKEQKHTMSTSFIIISVEGEDFLVAQNKNSIAVTKLQNKPLVHPNEII